MERNAKKTAEQLAAYQTYEKMLKATALREEEGGRERTGERVMLTMRMREIERLLRELPIGNVRLLLELHYLQGMSVEGCAAQMGISRATAFRLKQRGLCMVAARTNRLADHA